MVKSKKNTAWLRLDNAAKIFPPTSNKRDPKVFRFACELYEDIDEKALQKALDKTLEAFTGYLSVLKHGLFWYYLENTDLKPVVHEENTNLCSPLYDVNEQTLLFDVSYYNKRINLEIYHALSDGTGALEFLRDLVCNYLSLVHRRELGSSPPSSGYDGSRSEQMADSFQKYYDPGSKGKAKSTRAYKLRGSRISENRIKVIEGVVPVDKVLELARSYGTTITVLLSAFFIKSIGDGMSVRDKKKPVNIAVPVNLRQFFGSESTRNFFAITNIGYDFGKSDNSLDAVIKSVTKQLKEKITEENLQNLLSSYVSMEKNFAVRWVPLILKDFFMRTGYKISEYSVTAALSNVGKVSMPEPYEKYIKLFDVFTSTEKLQICMCSFKNNMVISFTDPFTNADVQKRFFRYLSSAGIEVEVVMNPLDEKRVEKQNTKKVRK